MEAGAGDSHGASRMVCEMHFDLQRFSQKPSHSYLPCQLCICIHTHDIVCMCGQLFYHALAHPTAFPFLYFRVGLLCSLWRWARDKGRENFPSSVVWSIINMFLVRKLSLYYITLCLILLWYSSSKILISRNSQGPHSYPSALVHYQKYRLTLFICLNPEEGAEQLILVRLSLKNFRRKDRFLPLLWNTEHCSAENQTWANFLCCEDQWKDIIYS